MTTAFAPAAVTAVLRARLVAYLAATGVSSSIGGVGVSTLPPDRIALGSQEKNALNVFLHRVSRNSAWANAMQPARNAAGDATAAPPFGANLHYVVTAYGQDHFAHDILLGHAVAAFHEEPVLTRAAIRRALAPNPPDPTLPAAVSQSGLADQIESLRMAMSSPTGEEIARLWSSFSCAYRPSTFWDVSVVLIDQRRGFAAPLPVRGVGAGTVSAHRPEIDDVAAVGDANAPIVATSTLVIKGSGLTGPGLEVRAGSSTAPAATVRDGEITAPVSTFTPALRAGVSGVWVTHSLPLGDPPVAHSVVAAEAVPIALHPTLTFANNAVATGSTSTIDGVPVASGTVTAKVAPRAGRAQQAVLLLSEVSGPADRPARGESLPAPANLGLGPNVDDTDTIVFAYKDVPRGPYVARLRVDGVDSPVTLGGSGVYDSPKVTL